MVIMRLLLLTVGLTLFFLGQAVEWPHMFCAPADKLLGKWYIHYWVGNMPIPENIKASPLPPFTFVKNIIGQLEFRMNISRNNLWWTVCQPMLILDLGLVISSSQSILDILFLKPAGQLHSSNVKMYTLKPIGCIVFKQALDYNERLPGAYYAWSRHYFAIYLVERDDVSLIQYLDRLEELNHTMVMLVGRSRIKEPRFLGHFETFTEFIGLNITEIIKPSYDDYCELSRES